MNTRTYEKIREVIRKKGYAVDSVFDFPDWNGRTLVTMTPEQAKSLIEHDGQLAKGRMSVTKPVDIENRIKTGTWSPEMGEVQLRSDFKVWKGMRILQAVADADRPVEVWINVLEDGSLSSAENASVCTTIVNAVADILEENGKHLPELDESVWQASLPKKLPDFDITIRSADAAGPLLEHPTVVGILAERRDRECPDMLHILRGTGQSGPAAGYPCDLLPSLSQEHPLALKPGMYEGLFSPAAVFKGLVQAAGAPLCIPVQRDGKIEAYESTSYDFMRISIPVQEPDNGIVPVGAEFPDTAVRDEFLSAMRLKSIQKNVTFILLEEKDLGE